MNPNEVDIMSLITEAELESHIAHMLAGTDITHGYYADGVIIGVSGTTGLASVVDYSLVTIDGNATNEASPVIGRA